MQALGHLANALKHVLLPFHSTWQVVSLLHDIGNQSYLYVLLELVYHYKSILFLSSNKASSLQFAEVDD